MADTINIMVSDTFAKTHLAPGLLRETMRMRYAIPHTGMLIRPDISHSVEMPPVMQNDVGSRAGNPSASAIPDEIAASLCACGGIEGLADLLPSEEKLERLSARHRACADPIRLRILAMLAVQPLCVCVIKAVTGIADSKLSYHLGVLKKAGLIAGEQQGNWIIYSLTAEAAGCLDF